MATMWTAMKFLAAKLLFLHRRERCCTKLADMSRKPANVAKTAAGLSENPGSTDDLVRDLEDSGYPVDGSREQFIRQPDGLSVATGGLAAAPVELDKRSAQRTCATPSDDRGTTGGDVAEQDNAAGIAGRVND
jgi:hypothetical protein